MQTLQFKMINHYQQIEMNETHTTSNFRNAKMRTEKLMKAISFKKKKIIEKRGKIEKLQQQKTKQIK